jgi:hypothetical protein
MFLPYLPFTSVPFDFCMLIFQEMYRCFCHICHSHLYVGTFKRSYFEKCTDVIAVYCLHVGTFSLLIVLVFRNVHM